MHPDWLGSPQHVFAGVLLSAVLTIGFGRRLPAVAAVLLGIGLTATAETVVELIEYPLLYSGEPNVTAYWDTLADLAATLTGALAGAAIAWAGMRSRRRAT